MERQAFSKQFSFLNYKACYIFPQIVLYFIRPHLSMSGTPFYAEAPLRKVSAGVKFRGRHACTHFSQRSLRGGERVGEFPVWLTSANDQRTSCRPFIVMQTSNQKNYIFHYPRVSPGATPLTKKPEDFGYEIGSQQRGLELATV